MHHADRHARGEDRQGEGRQAQAVEAAGPTKAQRAQRTAAVAELRRQGFTTLKLADYDYKATLRVLVGRPVGDAAGGSYAFFFLKDRYPRQGLDHAVQQGQRGQDREVPGDARLRDERGAHEGALQA